MDSKGPAGAYPLAADPSPSGLYAKSAVRGRFGVPAAPRGTAFITILFPPPRFPIAALRGRADLAGAMNPYPHFADAAWLRLAIVGADILAVVVTVRVCSVLTAWWRTLHASPPAPTTVRPPGLQRAGR
jgi:hypothetical protein